MARNGAGAGACEEAVVVSVGESVVVSVCEAVLGSEVGTGVAVGEVPPTQAVRIMATNSASISSVFKLTSRLMSDR